MRIIVAGDVQISSDVDSFERMLEVFEEIYRVDREAVAKVEELNRHFAEGREE